MSFKKAREIFELAQETALNSDDQIAEGIAAGLIELSKALATELQKLDNKINSLELAVRRLR